MDTLRPNPPPSPQVLGYAQDTGWTSAATGNALRWMLRITAAYGCTIATAYWLTYAYPFANRDDDWWDFRLMRLDPLLGDSTNLTIAVLVAMWLVVALACIAMLRRLRAMRIPLVISIWICFLLVAAPQISQLIDDAKYFKMIYVMYFVFQVSTVLEKVMFQCAPLLFLLFLLRLAKEKPLSISSTAVTRLGALICALLGIFNIIQYLITWTVTKRVHSWVAGPDPLFSASGLHARLGLIRFCTDPLFSLALFLWGCLILLRPGRFSRAMLLIARLQLLIVSLLAIENIAAFALGFFRIVHIGQYGGNLAVVVPGIAGTLYDGVTTATLAASIAIFFSMPALAAQRRLRP